MGTYDDPVHFLFRLQVLLVQERHSERVSSARLNDEMAEKVVRRNHCDLLKHVVLPYVVAVFRGVGGSVCDPEFLATDETFEGRVAGTRVSTSST